MKKQFDDFLSKLSGYFSNSKIISGTTALVVIAFFSGVLLPSFVNSKRSVASVQLSQVLSALSDDVQLDFSLGNDTAGHIGQTSTVLGRLSYAPESTNATVYGFGAGASGMTAANTTCIGTFSCQHLQGPLDNTAVGYNALNKTTSGEANTAVGMRALVLNQTGSHNVAVGKSALDANVTGQGNVAVGSGALYSNKTGSANVAVGISSMYTLVNGTGNTAIGTDACHGATNGAEFNGNTCIGNQALGEYATSASFNFAGGMEGLNGVTTGSYNTAIGGLRTGADWDPNNHQSDIKGITTGSYNTLLGSYANPALGNLNSTIVIGHGGIAPFSHTAVIGSNDNNGVIGDFYFNGYQPRPGGNSLGITVHSMSAIGADHVGSDFVFAAGQGTGNAPSGSMRFQIAPAGSSGSSLNPLVTALAIVSGGNVGVGTTNPNSKLEVNGDITITKGSGGAIYFSDGTSIKSARDFSTSTIIPITPPPIILPPPLPPNSQTGNLLTLPIVTKSSAYTLTADDYTVALGGNSYYSVTLPSAVGITGRVYVIKKMDKVSGTAYDKKIITTSSQTIDGLTSKTLKTRYSSIVVQSDGANWIILSSN